jgi:7,8-dihydropterin-6-yl-methyl-4-(beta-D-ribofuranosyl)aminobenzene 5'-phosphate synthase
VFTACSRAGVVNVGLEARRLLPGEPIDLLLGGYHLAGTTVVVGTRYVLNAP